MVEEEEEEEELLVVEGLAAADQQVQAIERQSRGGTAVGSLPGQGQAEAAAARADVGNYVETVHGKNRTDEPYRNLTHLSALGL